MQQRYLLRSELENLKGPQGIAGGPYNWHGDYDPAHAYVANDAVRTSEGRCFFALQATTGNAPPSYPDTDNAYWAMYGGEKGDTGADGSTIIWRDMPGSPARESDTSFSITDTLNENLYYEVLAPGTIISWEMLGGAWQAAKVTASSYEDDTATITIIGNTLSAGFSNMKYCIHKALEDIWAIPSQMPIAALPDIGKTIIWRDDRYVFSAQVIYQTAPTTTTGAWDINSDAVTIFTSKPSIAAGDTEGTEVVCDSLNGTDVIMVTAKSKITLDYDSGDATAPGSDAYIFVWSMNVGWRYMD